MNRYIDRYVLALVGILLFSSAGYSQIALNGPETAAPGELTKVQVKTDGAADLKITVLQNGKPTTQGFSTLKELDDTPVVLFYTKTSAVFTIIASGVKDGKHQVVIFVLTIANPVPIPDPTPVPKVPDVPPPQPKPVLVGLNKDIYDLYNPNKDAGSLDLLIATFEDTKAFLPNLKTFGDFETSIAATAAKRLNSQTKLRSVRDRIGDYLIAQTGSDPRAWNQAKASQVCDDVIAALKGCK